MKRYILEYNYGGDSEYQHFACWADDPEHAREQLDDAEPDATNITIFAPVEE